MKGAYKIEDANSLWNGEELHQLYKQAYTPWNWHEAIFNRAKEKGMLAFSSPFDESSVDFLEKLNVPCYKIASFENTHHPLLKKVAKTGKPVIMSTGVSTLEDIEESVKVLRDAGCNQLIILKCTSTYPANPENTNLNTIPKLKELFNCIVGLSDHTMGIGASVAAVALGARVIEKHFTLRRSDGGVDSAFSLEPEEFKSLAHSIINISTALGHDDWQINPIEDESRRFRRSLYITQDVSKGDLLTPANVRSIRPSNGIAPKYLNEVLGKRFTGSLTMGTALSWEHFS
jgi:N-acetylneuraminate synthase